MHEIEYGTVRIFLSHLVSLQVVIARMEKMTLSECY